MDWTGDAARRGLLDLSAMVSFQRMQVHAAWEIQLTRFTRRYIRHEALSGDNGQGNRRLGRLDCWGSRGWQVRTQLQVIVSRGPPMEIRKTWGVHESLGGGVWRRRAPTGVWLFQASVLPIR